MTLLSTIRDPDDLKRLRRDQLPELAQEVRERLIEACSITGGHIGASLGVVELTIALLYEFESPTDKIVWDVGHQAYAWKLLTGRNERFDSLRQLSLASPSAAQQKKAATAAFFSLLEGNDHIARFNPTITTSFF